MRTKNMLFTAAVTGVAVVAGLLGVGGTWALWSVSVPADAGTVQAANFDVMVNGRSIPSDGATVSIELEDRAAKLSPTEEVYAAVTVAHATNASGPLDIEVNLGAPEAASSTGSLMRQSLVLGTAPLTSERCSSIPASSYSARPTSLQIAKDESATYCIRVSIAPEAPSTLGGRRVHITLPLSISQVPAGTR